ncbi:unnamed protein product [Linum tenue]|uniref:Uncharacterized protein n=1 Tax=Linum tenue TaxID=586396 RepID=A0AAV0H8Y9_9ROSI|nr:unnamed protein product [Linum tenue]
MRTRSKKASAFLKHTISLLASALLKAKSAAVGDKTRAVLKARMAMTSLVMERKRKVMQLQLASVCDKINTVFGGSSRHDDHHHEDHLAMVVYDPNRKSRADASCCSCCCTTCCNDDGQAVLDIAHCRSQEAGQPGLVKVGGSECNIISNEGEQCCPYYDDQDDDDLVIIKGNKEEDDDYGHHVHDDDENIDDVADMFIVKFHKQMRLQKLESFKRYQEMLQRSL